MTITPAQQRILIIVVTLICALGVIDTLTTPPTTPNDIKAAEMYLETANLPTPPQPFTHDGCTLWPDVLPGHDFRPACLTHDIAYWAGGPSETKEHADLAFYKELRHTGILGYFPVAHLMYGGVYLFGDSFLTKWLDAHWGYGYE